MTNNIFSILSDDALRWAINFHSQHSDGDICPKILEIDAIKSSTDDFILSVINNCAL